MKTDGPLPPPDARILDEARKMSDPALNGGWTYVFWDKAGGWTDPRGYFDPAYRKIVTVHRDPPGLC